MFANVLDTVKITNWDKFPNVKGIVFDTYHFRDIDAFKNVPCGYGSKGYACSCGTTFVSHYQICPHCGNREFLGEELWNVYIHDSVCNVGTYRYLLGHSNNEFFIDKTDENIRPFEDTRVNYVDIYTKYPELLNIPKYKAMWELACYLDNSVAEATWWTTNHLLTKMLEATGKYDIELAKQFADMFEYPSQLTSFLGSSDSIKMLLFLKSMNCNVDLIKHTNVYDLAWNYAPINALPKKVVNAALKGTHKNLYGSLITMGEMIKKYQTNPKCIPMACYFLENMDSKTPCKAEIPIFMEWAINTDEEVTMEKFYWYLNAKYIQRANMNDKFEKILDVFNKDPINALIKLTKS
jgi:hypothetical protein